MPSTSSPRGVNDPSATKSNASLETTHRHETEGLVGILSMAKGVELPWETVAMSTLQLLTDRGLVKPPRWLPGNVQYETIMGSVAYGVSSDTSDVDVYGWAIPHKDDLFPHLRGEVLGFGSPRPRFEQYQEHHIQDQDALAGHGRTYDLTIYGIVKFFNLAMENNPNVIDSLFTPVNCVLHSTRVGNLGERTEGCSSTKGHGPSSRATLTPSCTSWRSRRRRASGQNWSRSMAMT